MFIDSRSLVDFCLSKNVLYVLLKFSERFPIAFLIKVKLLLKFSSLFFFKSVNAFVYCSDIRFIKTIPPLKFSVIFPFNNFTKRINDNCGYNIVRVMSQRSSVGCLIAEVFIFAESPAETATFTSRKS